MRKRNMIRGATLVVALLVASATLVQGAVPLTAPAGLEAPAAAAPTLVYSYAAKFVCQESLKGEKIWFGPLAPILEQKTDVLVHNPNAFQVVFYKKAVRAPLEWQPPIAPGAYKQFTLSAGQSVRIDCDDIAKLLTGDPNATFINVYGIGVAVEGFVVIAIGPQASPATTARYVPLDVTAEYARSTEVMKKDIHFQPWWRYWPWKLPWVLGRPYHRLVKIDADIANDCRENLVKQLMDDISTMPPPAGPMTQAALAQGLTYDSSMPPGDGDPPALVALMGSCELTPQGYGWADFVLVSNKSELELGPAGVTAPSIQLYPWIPGRWYDTAIVLPQNTNIDMNALIVDWQAQRWIDLGVPSSDVYSTMKYFLPWWCGYGYWYPWQGPSCIDIGVGGGESLDVEQIIPSRVFLTPWPPIQ